MGMLHKNYQNKEIRLTSVQLFNPSNKTKYDTIKLGIIFLNNKEIFRYLK